MKIALVQGGLGQEAEVSRNTGKSFEEALVSLGYSYVVIEADENLIQNLIKEKPNVALIALHGKYAEDGTVQGICEYLKIPYTGSGILASALAMDKLRTKEVLSFYNIPTPKFQVFFREEMQSEDFQLEMDLPVVVKPAREGSSVGISMVSSEEQLVPALNLASKYDRCVLVEAFVDGVEVTVPIVQGKALTPIEIKPKQGFYDYTNKYTAGNTNYYLPPNLEEALVDKIKSLAVDCFVRLDLHHYARIDFMVDRAGGVFFIEANTLPGCTKTSLLPQSAKHDGIPFTDLIQGMIDNARLDYEGVI